MTLLYAWIFISILGWFISFVLLYHFLSYYSYINILQNLNNHADFAKCINGNIKTPSLNTIYYDSTDINTRKKIIIIKDHDRQKILREYTLVYAYDVDGKQINIESSSNIDMYDSNNNNNRKKLEKLNDTFFIEDSYKGFFYDEKFVLFYFQDVCINTILVGNIFMILFLLLFSIPSVIIIYKKFNKIILSIMQIASSGKDAFNYLAEKGKSGLELGEEKISSVAESGKTLFYIFIGLYIIIFIVLSILCFVIIFILSIYFVNLSPNLVLLCVVVISILSILFPSLTLFFVMVFFVAMLIISALPLIRLKYHNDIAESAENMTQHCYKNLDTDYIPEKHKYIYYMCTQLYGEEFNDPETLDLSSTSKQDELRGKEFGHMPLYKEYLSYSIGAFLFAWFFVIGYGILFSESFSKPYISFSLLGIIIFLVLLFTIIFSIILKKITEIYNDTKLFRYYKLMSMLNKYIKDYKNKAGISEDDFNTLIATITYNNKDVHYNEGDDNNYAKNLVLNDETIGYLLDKFKCTEPCVIGKDFACINAPDQKTRCILKEYLDWHSYLHSKKHIDEVKYRVNTVISFLIAYAVFAFFLIYFLFKIFNELLAVNLVYTYACIIIAYLLAIMLYFIIMSIRQD